MHDAPDPAELLTVCDDRDVRHLLQRRLITGGGWRTVYRCSKRGSCASSDGGGDE